VRAGVLRVFQERTRHCIFCNIESGAGAKSISKASELARADAIAVQKNCEDSWFGCCPDGKTPALGADNAGCPSTCNCNKLGKYTYFPRARDPQQQLTQKLPRGKLFHTHFKFYHKVKISPHLTPPVSTSGAKFVRIGCLREWLSNTQSL
jgi:hypothetical protein